MKLCLFGAGRWGRNYIRTLEQTNFELVAIIDPLYSGDITKYNSMEEIDIDYDAAIVATPIITHYALVEKLLSAGKHVLVEKPMTMSSEDSMELIHLAEEQNKTIMVGYNVLYLPLYQYIDSSRLISYSSNRSVEYNNNYQHVLYDLLCHDIAIILKIMKCAPIGVEYIGTYNEGTLLLDYERFTLSCFASRYKKKCRTISCRTIDEFIELDDLSKTIKTNHVLDYSEDTPPLLAQCLDFYQHAVNNKQHEENVLIAIEVDRIIEKALR